MSRLPLFLFWIMLASDPQFHRKAQAELTKFFSFEPERADG